LTSSGGWDSWREEGEASILADTSYPGLTWRSEARAVVPSTGQRRVVAKPGEIPAQSRYGERFLESASPVADHTVHARTFERKVGRSRALFRLDPSFDTFESRGFAIPRDPLRSPPEVPA
jgi:hypothetical protein